MTQEEKQILCKDLCARVPYGVIYHRNDGANIELREVDVKNGTLNYTDNIVVRDCKPYLRPMSSMTVSEELEFTSLCLKHAGKPEIENMVIELSEFYNKKHLDYRGLIEKGLALEAPEGMYKNE